MARPEIIVNSGEGLFLEATLVGVLFLVLVMVYVAYLSLQYEMHSPAPLRSGQ